MLHDGYIYENEAGTLTMKCLKQWKMFTGPADKQTIIDEFRDRSTIRFTG
jgi:hypothetical protein